jgi:hypothetical protein
LLPDLPLRVENIGIFSFFQAAILNLLSQKTVKMNQISNNVSRMPVYFINPSIKATPLKCKDHENHQLG